MASKAQPKSGTRPPVSAHPAFPAIVALWFAALLGIGSMMLPTILLERVVETIGLPSIFEATTPPLGFGAKALIALAAAVIGAICGLVIARKVVAANAAPAKPRKRGANARRAVDVPAKRPIVATEELGEEGLGPVAEDHAMDDYDDEDEDEEDEFEQGPPLAAPIPGRRRPLSVTDDSGPSDFLVSVPLPGDPDPYRDAAPEAVAADHAGALHSSAIAAEDAPRPFDLPLAMPAEDAVIIDAASDTASDVEPRDPDVLHLAAAEEEPVMPEHAFSRSPLDLRPADEAAPAFAAPVTEAEQPARQIFGAPQQPVPAPIAPFAAPQGNARSLAELSMADLIARFGRALEAERQAPVAAPEAPSAALPAFAPPTIAEPETDDQPVAFTFQRAPAAAADAARPFAAPASKEEVASAPEPLAPVQMFAAAEEAPAAVPQALRPLDLGEFDEDEQDDDPFADDFGLPFGGATAARSFDQPEGEAAPAFAAPFAAHPAEADEDEDANEDAYSSLLSMKSPFGAGREFVRIEDEDDEMAGADAVPDAVVTFPGDRPAVPTGFDGARPFDAPQGPAPFAQPGSPLSRAVPTTPAQRPADPAETERALRDALDKLQRMSGAA